MLDKKDLNKYNTASSSSPSQRAEGELSQSAAATAKTVGGMAWKALKTILCVLFISGVLVFLSVAAFLLSFRDIEAPNLSAMSLNYSSFVYVDDEAGNATEYMTIHADENRVWASLSDIPAYMKTAQVCIEDHRFCEHSGVDWRTTLNAVLKLFSGGSGGGSTMTQQLIKNITEDKDYSILRKVREIFTALNLEKKYSKQQILEAYLNVVNYGGQNNGVEAAAQAYFGKSIRECTLAECALIAGITQNPSQYNPLIFPDEAKTRAQIVLDRMWELSDGIDDGDNQEMYISPEMEGQLVPITEEEYNQATAELAAMTFDGDQSQDTESVEEQQDVNDWNWYMDTMFNDIVDDLMEQYGYGRDAAINMIYNGGLEIHSAMNPQIQSDLEEMFLNGDCMPDDTDIQAGMFIMDPYTGKVIAVLGSRDERDGILLWNNATMTERQPGSSFKPLSAYSLGIENGAITYGSVLNDEPLEGSEEWNDGVGWPQNVSRTYKGHMNVDDAIMISQNAPVAWLVEDLTTQACYEWLTEKLHFTTLTETDAQSVSAMALGGMDYGVTVREMTAAYCTFANGGYYYEPYTYYYVKDHDGNVSLDNRANTGEQVMSTETATIMNKLLHLPVTSSRSGIGVGTALYAMDGIGLDMFAKTGTTDNAYDLTFMGGTNFCVAGIWNGYEYSAELYDSNTCKVTWRAVIEYLANNYDWSGKEWVLSDNVSQYAFCRSSGKLAGTNCYDTAYGWYDNNNLPGRCNGGSDHIAGPAVSPSPSPSVSPDASLSPSTSPDATTGPSVSPGPTESAEPTPGASAEPTPGSTDEPIETTPTPTPETPTEPTPEPPSSEPSESPTEEPPSSSSGTEGGGSEAGSGATG